MERVILITTREVEKVLSGFDRACVKSINSCNYNKVFFIVEGNASALNRFFTEQPRGFDKSQFNIDINEDDCEFSSILTDRVLNSCNHVVKQMFDALLYGNNINFLGSASIYPNINKVRDGIFRINKTNIFICHEWFSKTIFLKNDIDGLLVEKTRKAYFRAIVDDIRCELGGNNSYEWVILAHDEDFDVHGCCEFTDKDVLKSVGLENDKKIIWIYQHITTDQLCKKIIRNDRSDKFDILIKSVDIRETLTNIVHPTYLSDTPQEEIDNSNKTEIITKNDYYISVNCDVLLRKIQTDEIIGVQEAEQRLADTIVDMIANYQRTEELGVQSLKKGASTGEIIIVSNRIIEKPIIVYWEGKPLSEISDKRRNYLDSSIWCRYAASRDEFERIGNELKKYSELYKTANAIEVKEFKARMALNSFLVETKHREHGQFVSPFLFHSEAEMERKVQVVITKLKDCVHDNVISKWRLLLVDDNAFNSETDTPVKIQKCEVITDILGKNFCIVCMNKDIAVCSNQKKLCATCVPNNSKPTIYIDCVRSIQDTHKKLKKRRYDIVLLDYLLGGEVNKPREYGTDLLIELKKQYEDKIHNKAELPNEEFETLNQYLKAKGPFGKFWIFFVSAFSNAISEKMLSEGIHYNTDYWYIARGACPTTTPELFRYNLYSLLYQQIKNITDVSVVKSGDDSAQADRRVITLIDLLGHIFADPVSTRSLALKNFNSLLHLRAHYDILKKDYYMGGKDNPDAKINGSPLVQSLFPDIEYYSNDFWEHIQHLIYLIAFGNIRQWNEMWDEYIFIRDILRKAEGKSKNEDNVVRKIEKYIIEIKNTNYR